MIYIKKGEKCMQEQISQIKEKALEAIKKAKDAKELDEVRVQYLGKKEN